MTQNEANNQNTSTTSNDSSDIIETTSNSNIPAKEETIVVSMETLKPKDNDVDKQL